MRSIKKPIDGHFSVHLRYQLSLGDMRHEYNRETVEIFDFQAQYNLSAVN